MVPLISVASLAKRPRSNFLFPLPLIFLFPLRLIFRPCRSFYLSVQKYGMVHVPCTKLLVNYFYTLSCSLITLRPPNCWRGPFPRDLFASQQLLQQHNNKTTQRTQGNSIQGHQHASHLWKQPKHTNTHINNRNKRACTHKNEIVPTRHLVGLVGGTLRVVGLVGVSQ